MSGKTLHIISIFEMNVIKNILICDFMISVAITLGDMDVATLGKGYMDEPFAQQRIFITFYPEQEQSTTLVVAQGEALPTQIYLNSSIKFGAVFNENRYEWISIKW